MIVIDTASGKRIRAEKKDVIKARKSMKLSQVEFAKLLHVSLSRVSSWEQGIRKPDGCASMVLLLILGGDKDILKFLFEHKDVVFSWEPLKKKEK